jgi:DNA-binding transcriptional ArsR family regulator
MMDADGDAQDGTLAETRRRRPATVEEAKALAHPLRLRILRLCAEQELTNKQLADRLDRDPATVYYHVRQLAEVGFLGAGTVRSGPSGALEKPYRATQNTWWLDDPLAQVGSDTAGLLFEAFQEELRAAGPAAVQWADRFMLHLSAEDVAKLERRILAILDEYVETDHERRDQPAYGGLVALHRLVDTSRPESAGD